MDVWFKAKERRNAEIRELLGLEHSEFGYQER